MKRERERDFYEVNNGGYIAKPSLRSQGRNEKLYLRYLRVVNYFFNLLLKKYRKLKKNEI